MVLTRYCVDLNWRLVSMMGCHQANIASDANFVGNFEPHHDGASAIRGLALCSWAALCMARDFPSFAYRPTKREGCL